MLVKSFTVFPLLSFSKCTWNERKPEPRKKCGKPLYKNSHQSNASLSQQRANYKTKNLFWMSSFQLTKLNPTKFSSSNCNITPKILITKICRHLYSHFKKKHSRKISWLRRKKPVSYRYNLQVPSYLHSPKKVHNKKKLIMN